MKIKFNLFQTGLLVGVAPGVNPASILVAAGATDAADVKNLYLQDLRWLRTKLPGQ